MDVKSFLQADLDDPKPFPKSFPQLQRLDCSVICTVCKEIFKGPVSITCGHSFCSAVRPRHVHLSEADNSAYALPSHFRRNVQPVGNRLQRARFGATVRWRRLPTHGRRLGMLIRTTRSDFCRPQLLEFTKPARKRERDSGGASSSGATKRARHSPSKRQSPSKSGDSSQSISASTSDQEVEVVADSSDVEEVQELSESGELACCKTQLTLQTRRHAPCVVPSSRSNQSQDISSEDVLHQRRR